MDESSAAAAITAIEQTNDVPAHNETDNNIITETSNKDAISVEKIGEVIKSDNRNSSSNNNNDVDNVSAEQNGEPASSLLPPAVDITKSVTVVGDIQQSTTISNVSTNIQNGNEASSSSNSVAASSSPSLVPVTVVETTIEGASNAAQTAADNGTKTPSGSNLSNTFSQADGKTSKGVKFGFGLKVIANLISPKAGNGTDPASRQGSTLGNSSTATPSDANEESLFQQGMGRPSKSVGKALKDRFTFTNNKKKQEQANGGVLDDEEGDAADSELPTFTRGEKKQRGESIFALSGAQQAFLPVCVRHLLSSTTTAIKVPQLFKDQGVVLFADISGFTALGKKLRSVEGTTQIEAAEQLAKRINDVLRRLTTECQNFGGDVAKFAGDALLCYWISHDNMESQIEKAKNCAVSMLKAVKEVDSELDVHGGIATGGLMHVHLGDSRSDKLRWYLITGEAVVAATNLVDKAERGKFIYQSKESQETIHHETNGENANSSSAAATTGKPGVKLEVITKETGNDHFGRDRTESVPVDPKSNLANPHGIAYIPLLLKSTLKFGIDVPEMRRRVAVVFAMLPDLTATNAEIRSQSISQSRLNELNDSFNALVSIAHKFDGEVRDLLFDDKGCVFIGVFGAHKAIEMPELKAAKAAMMMLEELDNIKIGVSVGTCFVGMCGNESRHDFVVMGHEVNMAARFMGKAPVGSMLVSHTIKEQTDELFDYKEVTVMLQKKTNEHTHDLDGYVAKELAKKGTLSDMRTASSNGSAPSGLSAAVSDSAQSSSDNAFMKKKKKGYDVNPSVYDPNGKCIAYTPQKEIRRRPSFLAQYRYAHLDFDIFVGRDRKIKGIESHVTKMFKEKTSGSILVSSPAGMGKSALIRQFRKLNSEKFNIVLGSSFPLELDTKFYVFRQLIETEFGIFEGMASSKARAIFKSWEQNGVTINWETLESIVPYIKSFLEVEESSPVKIESKRSIFTQLTSFRMSKNRESGQHQAVEGSDSPSKASASTPNVPSGATDTSQSQLNKRAALTLSQSMGNSVRSLFGGGSSANNQAGVRSSREIGGSVDTGTSSPAKVAGRKGLLSKEDMAAASGNQSPEVKVRQKMHKRKSNLTDVANILSATKINNALELFLGLLKIAQKNATTAGKKGYVIVFEDLQWMDLPSLQLLEELQKLIANDKMLPGVTLIVSSRPITKQDAGDPQSLASHNTLRSLMIESLFDMAKGKKQQTRTANYHSIVLKTLSKANTAKFLQSILVQAPGESVSKELTDTIFSKTDGFPLHIVVTVNWLFDNEGIIKDANGVKKLKNQAVNDISYQNEANGAFITKFDALPQDVRNILKIASCIGERFKASDIQKIYAKDVENKNKDSVIDVRTSKERPIEEREVVRMLEYAAKEGLLKKVKRVEWTWNHPAIQTNIHDLLPVERKNEISQIYKSLNEFDEADAAEVLSRFSAFDM